MRLQGKVALITGSTQGLGEGIALRCAQEGAQVVVNGRSVEKGEAVVAKLRSRGGDAHFIRADVSQQNQAVFLVQQAAAHFGRLDILINNAQAVPDLIPSIEERGAEYFDQALHSGLYGSLWTSQAALPFFRAVGGGRIVNFASINGVYGSKYGAAYNSAKEAIRGLTRTLANEWGRYNVTVNVVLPSGLSPAYEAFYQDDPKKADAVARLNPMRRHGRADWDIGSAVLGLVSDYARYITGQSLFIDGGANLIGLPQLHTAGTIYHERGQ
jgi:NAD(P)-dependent dehydrogenase (short-subunit alcohol dehydrogenase family)